MIIKRPVFFIEIEGDVKYQATQIPITVIASYEEHLNKTYVVVYADDKKFIKNVKDIYYNIHSDIKKQEHKLKTPQLEIKYLEQGLHFIQK